jgi:subtilisin
MSRQGTTRRGVLRQIGIGAVGTAGLAATGGVAARPDEKIVGLEAGASPAVAADRADAVRKTLDFGDVGKAVVGRFSEQALDALGKRKEVRYTENNGTMHALKPGKGGGNDKGGSQPAECLPWGIDRVDSDVAHANGDRGAGADVAVLDTGIDSDHPDLKENLGAGKAFVKCKGGSCNYRWDDDEGHGTHVAGTVAGVDNTDDIGVIGQAPDATLHAVKVLDKRGSGSFADIADGVRYVADQGWDVINMSLGASSGSQALKDACQYAYDNGVLIIAAAGNSGPCTDCVGYPAVYSTVVGVGSTTKSDTLSDFSSTGPEVEIAAPGSNIYSTVPDGSYDTLSGTSMASPHVAGAGALLVAAGESNTKARDTLTSSAEDLGLADNESGAGLLDVAAALGYDSSDDGTGNC